VWLKYQVALAFCDRIVHNKTTIAADGFPLLAKYLSIEILWFQRFIWQQMFAK